MLCCCISNSFEISDFCVSRGVTPEDLPAFILDHFLPPSLLFLVGAIDPHCSLQSSVLVNILAQCLVHGKDSTQAVCYYCIFLGHTWNHLGVVLHSCKPNTREAELEASQVGVLLGLHTKTLFNKKRTELLSLRGGSVLHSCPVILSFTDIEMLA